MTTQSLLLLDKAVHGEAVAELTKAPLITNNTMLSVLHHYSLTVAHLIPLRALRHIGHAHIDRLGYPATYLWRLLWCGDELTDDFDHGVSIPGYILPLNY